MTKDHLPKDHNEPHTWADYTLWSVVLFCIITQFVFMDKPVC